MASNTALIEVKDRGRLNGFAALWRKESRLWWGTRSWLVKILIWIWVLDGMLAMVLFSSPVVAGAETSQAMRLRFRSSRRPCRCTFSSPRCCRHSA
jgi:hypothetical protein